MDKKTREKIGKAVRAANEAKRNAEERRRHLEEAADRMPVFIRLPVVELPKPVKGSRRR